MLIISTEVWLSKLQRQTLVCFLAGLKSDGQFR